MARNRNASAIALLLTLTIALTLISIPSANSVVAQRDTFAFVTANPDPIGVGQEALVVMWLSEPLPSDRFRRGGYQLVITKPDGTTETKGPFTAESTGSTYTTFVPNTVGNYSFQLKFLGEWLNYTGPHPVTRVNGNWTIYYKPSSSSKYTLVVQDEPITHLPDNPIPTGYWTRPIHGEGRNWASLAGPWLQPAYGDGYPSFGLAGINLDTDAPESGHVMWTRELEFGGIVGGEAQWDLGYYSGLSYERKYAGMVMQGRLYYSVPSYNTYGWYCIDLRTGEELYYKNDTQRPNQGQIVRMDTPNQHGNIPYLWSSGFGSTPWRLYDPFTGNWLCDVANVSGGTTILGPSGELLRYNLYTEGGVRKLSLWNSSEIDAFRDVAYGESSIRWRIPQGRTVDGGTGMQWIKNVTRVSGDPGINRIDPELGIIYCRTQAFTPDNAVVAIHAAYKTDGTFLWAANRTGLAADVNFVNLGAMGEGIYCEYIRETLSWYAYDVNTGALKWAHQFSNPWSMYYGCSGIAYGKFYTSHYDGLHALDVETGEELWHYRIPAGFETPYGVYPIFTFHDGFMVADGKIYGCTGEHSPNDPLYRGEKLHCVDAETGIGLWNISFWGIPPPIAEGYLVTQNIYDNRIYCIGKGPSATAVSIQDNTVVEGDSVVIEGTILDVSAGTKQKEQTARFPNGVAAVSDDSQSAWMEYVYMQKAFPSDCQGVTVTIDVFDANGNYRNIGTATSDASGAYGFVWKPDIPGMYRVIATFAGSKSYGGSYAETFFNVQEAPAEEEAPPESPPDMTGTYIMYSTIAIIIAIVVGFAVAIFMLKKR